jgi:hypothetical protein
MRPGDPPARDRSRSPLPTPSAQSIVRTDVPWTGSGPTDCELGAPEQADRVS